MKILLDENIASKIREGLIELGFTDTVHINDIAKGVTDNEVFTLAQNDDRTIITGDDDFKANNFKYKNTIIWVTPKARIKKDICNKIEWILNNIDKYNVNIKKAFISIRRDMYVIEYKNRDGVFGKIKRIEISFDSIKNKKTKNKHKIKK